MIPNMRFPGIINTRALLRETEQTSSATLTILDRHTYVTILGHPATGSRRTQVQDGNTIGWVNSNSIEAAQRLGIINAATPLRRDSNRSETTTIRNLPRNHHVTILGMNATGSRTQVRDGNTIGWVNSNSIEAAQRPGIISAATPLRRDSNRSETTTIRNLPRNHHVTILGMNATGSRTQVRDGNTIGWVNSNSIEAAQRPGIISAATPLRRDSNRSETTTIRNLPRNHHVTILGMNATGSRTQVRDGNIIGWVNSNSIEAAQRPGIISAATPLRRDSNRSATTIVRNLPRNHHVIILGHNANGSRTQVRDEHLIGWVNNNSIEAARRQGIVRSTAQLRQRSDTSSLTVHAIRSNEYVTIFGINLTGDRTQVQHENTIGWVSSHLIAHAKREQFIIGSERATFRRGARASADLIRRLPEGTRLIVLGVSTNGERTHVQVGTERGWVRTDRMGLPDLIPVNGMNYRTMNEQQLAQEILNRHHGTSTSGRRITLLVTFEDMNVTNGRSSFGNIRDVAAAKGAMTHWGRRDLSPDLLRAMLRMNDQFGTFQVNTIAGGMHLGGSNDPHARGLAVDIQSTNHIVNGISQTPTAILNHLEGVWNFRTQRNHRGSTYVGSSHHFHLEIWGRN